MSGLELGEDLKKLRIDRSKKLKGGLPGWIYGLVAMMAVGGGGYAVYSRVTAPIPVRVGRAEIETVGPGASVAPGTEVLTAGGYIIPRDRVEISSKIVGRVADVLVRRGDLVKQGDVLVRLEDHEYQAQVDLAAAQVASARARLDQLESGSRPQEIAAADATLASAEAELIRAEADLKRLERLAGEGVISTQEFDQAKAGFGVMLARRNEARENAQLVRIGPREEEIEGARAALQQAQANLDYARTQLDFTVIRAPIAGTVMDEPAKKGEMVTNSNFGGDRGAKSAVASLADLTDLQVELDVNENDLPKVRLGQPCLIRLDSEPENPLEGVVDEIAPEADRQQATVEVKIGIKKTDRPVRPELNARVTFLEPASEEAMATEEDAGPKEIVWAPRGAIVDGEGGPRVFVASDGVAVARAVSIGREGPRGVAVEQGLIGTELLILEPSADVRDGRRVEPMP